MSEVILRALMRLFAIVADANSESAEFEAKRYVSIYLKRFLDEANTEKYLAVFDEYVELHHKTRNKEKKSGAIKRVSLNSVKVLTICEKINQELEQHQKILVLVQLLEYVAFNNEVSENEISFVETVANSFNISYKEYLDCRNFMHGNYQDIPSKENVLILTNDKEKREPGIKYLYSEHIGGNLVILHIKSTNTFAFRYFGKEALTLNGHHIFTNHAYLLDKGASIRSPKLSTIYYSDINNQFLQTEDKPIFAFNADNVNFRFKNSDNGIHDFTFFENSGQLVGIMGGSGVGKSTLLNILNGIVTPTSGSVKINGLDVHHDRKELEGVIGFIPQDDLLLEDLTVYQNLYYNARLCFDGFSEDKLNEAVDRTLRELGLFEIKHLKVGGVLNKFISGGQRKRLNIALELIREPSVLFVDEPTSGLSSMDSYTVMDLLKELTLKGKLIIVNIHQPSSDIYKMFDKLIILDKGGYSIYNGNPIDAVVYFKTLSQQINPTESECLACGNVNPEQVLEIVESRVVNEYGRLTETRKVSPKEWYNSFKEHAKEKKPIECNDKLPENLLKIPSRFKQFIIFTTRDILSKLTNTQYLLINFLEAPLLAVILGYFTKYVQKSPTGHNLYKFSENDNLFAYMFMAVVVALFLGMTVSAEEIIKDRKILKRENFLKLSWFSYINSKFLILIIISAIQMFTFVLVGNFIIEIQGMTTSYWLILFSASVFANALGLNLSSSLNSVVTIYIMIPFILVPQLLFSGVIVPYDKLHEKIASNEYVPIIGDLMISRWAYEALAVHQFKSNAYNTCFYAFHQTESAAGYISESLISNGRILNTLMEKCLTNMEKDKDPEETKRTLALLTNEFNDLMAKSDSKPFKEIDSLTPEAFNAGIMKKADNYLQTIRKEYSKIKNTAMKAREKRLSALIDSFPNGNEDYVKFKEANDNNKLEQFVSNKTVELSDGFDFYGVKETYDHLIQIKDPIYKIPTANNGRAHFYAPVKRFVGIYIDTFWFNLIVIWLTVILLYVALYFNWLQKGLDGLGKIKLKKYKN